MDKAPIASAKAISEEALLAGLGVMSLAKGRVEEFIGSLVKDGKLAIKDQKNLRKRLIAEGQKEYRTMTRGYQKIVRETLKTLNVPTRSEFDALKRLVEKKRR